MTPKIYSLKEHSIPKENIDPKVYYIIQKLRLEGHTAYLVGGSVRDLLLKVPPKDFDIATSAKPLEIRKHFHNSILIGRRFPLAHIRFGKKIFEVATFRAGDVDEKRLITRDILWGNEEQDVLRRDFTMNGLFYDPETETIIDYVGGFDDLKKRLIRTIGDPELRFIQDPVRMIRLLKFRARFSLDIDPITYQALEKCRQEIIKSSSARILEELLRMLESGASKPFFSLLHLHGLLEYLSPPLAHFFALEEKQELLALLHQVDELMKQPLDGKMSRSVLLSSLVFPLFDRFLQGEFLDRHKEHHLGMIQQEARILLHEIFSPFFLISRKMKGEMISILTNQYRFFPLLEKDRKKYPRLPRDPSLPLSIFFLKIRSLANEALFPVYSRWKEVISYKREHRGFRRRNGV